MKFTELKVWQESKELVVKIYDLTPSFPKEEQYELVKRLKRAAIASTSNIAKGSDGMTDEETIYYLGMARKNQSDIESQLNIAKELGFMEKKVFDAMIKDLETCQKMTYGFIRYIKNKKEGEDGENPKKKLKKVEAA